MNEQITDKPAVHVGEGIREDIAWYMSSASEHLRFGKWTDALRCYRQIEFKIKPILTIEERKKLKEIVKYVFVARKEHPGYTRMMKEWNDNKHMWYYEAQNKHLRPPRWNLKKYGAPYIWDPKELESRIYRYLDYVNQIMQDHAIYLPIKGEDAE